MTIKILGSEVEYGAKKATLFGHAEGYATAVTGLYGHAEGSGSLASGIAGHGEGLGGYATGDYSHAEGYNSASPGLYSHAGGWAGRSDAIGAHARGHAGTTAIAAQRAQVATYTASIVTTSTTATPLTFDGSATVSVAASNANVLVVQPLTNYLFQATISCRRPGGTAASQGWVYAGMIVRDSGVPRIVGSVAQLATWSDSAMGSVSFVANTTSNYLAINATAGATTALTWHCVLTVNELVLNT